MLMKKSFILLAAAALTLVACNKTVTVAENEGDAISFRPLMTNLTKVSTTADVTTANLTSFTVNAKIASSETSYFDNAVYTGSTGSTFTCTEKYYWPATESLDFYAYSYTDNASQVSVTNYKTIVVTPTSGTDPANQVDLVYASTKGKNKASSGNSGVTLNFRHTGAKIVCKVLNTSNSMRFVIEGWKVGYLYPNGTFVFADSNTDGII